MIAIRSVLLALLMLAATPVFCLIALLVSPLPGQLRYRIIGGWTHIVLWGTRNIAGIRHEVRGAHNIPAEAAVILSKHQSAWETMAFQEIFPPVCFVLKKELLRVPFFGWGLAQMPKISIDRKAGKNALDQVLEQGRQRLAEGFFVVVFPEGTRVAPGSTKRYKPGGAHLAAKTGTKVVPVAHNAGELWPRNAFLKHPGTITVSIGPPIDTRGLGTEEINQRAEAWIEAEMRRISPQSYTDAEAVARTAA